MNCFPCGDSYQYEFRDVFIVHMYNLKCNTILFCSQCLSGVKQINVSKFRPTREQPINVKFSLFFS